MKKHSEVRSRKSEDRKIRRWEDKKIELLNFSTSQLLNLTLLLFTIHYSLFTTSFASTVDDLIEQIQKRYSEIQEIKGRFYQVSHIKELDKIHRYEGRFFISRHAKAKMRLVYTKPEEEVIIRDTDIWIYKKSERQVFKTKFSRDSYGQVPLSLLQGLGNLRRDFNITLTGENTLELRPKGKMDVIKKIRLVTTAGDFPINSLTLFDVYGNKTQIFIKDIEINPGLDESIFNIPKDVEVFELDAFRR